jgi:hypothetical protein
MWINDIRNRKTRKTRKTDKGRYKMTLGKKLTKKAGTRDQ